MIRGLRCGRGLIGLGEGELALELLELLDVLSLPDSESELEDVASEEVLEEESSSELISSSEEDCEPGSRCRRCSKTPKPRFWRSYLTSKGSRMRWIEYTPHFYVSLIRVDILDIDGTRVALRAANELCV